MGTKIKNWGFAPLYFLERQRWKLETKRKPRAEKKENAPQQKKSWCESTEGRKYG